MRDHKIAKMNEILFAKLLNVIAIRDRKPWNAHKHV